MFKRTGGQPRPKRVMNQKPVVAERQPLAAAPKPLLQPVEAPRLRLAIMTTWDEER